MISRRAFLAGATALAGCSGGGDGPAPSPPVPGPVAPERIDIAPYVARRDFARVSVEAAVEQARNPLLAPVMPAGPSFDDLRRALDSGRPVNGMGVTYAGAGALDLPPGAVLYDARLMQLQPNQDDVCTLRGGGGAILLSNVEIDRGGDGRGGSQAHAAQALFTDVNLIAADLRIVGSSRGAGIKLVRCRGQLLAPSVGDNTIRTDIEPLDDQQDAMWFLDCSGLDVLDPVWTRLYTDWGLGPRPCYSRGLTVGGGSDIAIFDFRGSLADQHVDITGDQDPHDITVLGGHAFGGRNFGVKCANTAYDIRVINILAEQMARTGFIASGPGPGVPAERSTRNITWQGCTARQIGASREFYGLDTSIGFKVEQGAPAGYPRNVLALDCVNEGGMTTYGFLNQVAGQNRQDGCRSIGSSAAEFVGF